MSAQAALVLDHTVVECGGVVTGTASWSGNTRHLQVGVVLRYWTQGRGDTDAAVAARCLLGTAEAGQAWFRVDVPPLGPVTYNGQLLRLFWQVEVWIPVDKAKGRRTSGLAGADLTVAPRGWLRLPPRYGRPGQSGRHGG